MNQLQTCAEQLAAVDEFFGELASDGRRLTYSRGTARHDDEREVKWRRFVRKAIDGYFKDLDGEKARGVYDMVINCVEKPLLESVLHQRAAATRRTPRKCWASTATRCARR